MDLDRMKKSFAGLVRAAFPRIDYMALYRAKVVQQNPPPPNDPTASGTLDVVPEDPKIPSMGGIPLRHGVPGLEVALQFGTTVLVGWEDGDPSQPYACLWAGGEVVTKLVFNATQFYAGGETGAQPPLLGTSYRAAQQPLHTQMATTLAAMASACTGPLAPLASGFTALATAIQAFEASAPTFLAANVRVK